MWAYVKCTKEVLEKRKSRYEEIETNKKNYACDEKEWKVKSKEDRT